MINRRFGATVFAAVLAFGALACDDNPVAESRDDSSRLLLSHDNAVVESGGNIVVTANVLNRYGEPTGTAVTGQACDNKITVAPDTARTAFEYPERFRITGAAFGATCIVVSGGGLTDTINVRVVASSVALQRRDTLQSGVSLPFAVQFLGATGAPVSGLTLANAGAVFSTSDTTRVVVDAQGNVSARAPGTAVVRVSSTTLGVTRTDSVRVTVVPGTFAGTASLATVPGGATVLSVTQGSLAFDADTDVTYTLPGGVVLPTWLTLAGSPAGTIRKVLPFGVPAGSLTFNVVNVGANQVALRGTINLPNGTPADDQLEPDESAATPKAMVPGEVFFGTVSDTDVEDLIKLTITEAGTYRVQLDWNEASGAGAPNGSDIDMYVLNSAFGTLLARETFSAPQEVGNVTLQPGTYYVYISVWEFANVRPTTYRVSVTKQ